MSSAFSWIWIAPSEVRVGVTVLAVCGVLQDSLVFPFLTFNPLPGMSVLGTPVVVIFSTP